MKKIVLSLACVVVGAATHGAEPARGTDAYEGRAAAVVPVKDAKAIKYSPMIFGQFIEHHDRQVYGGLFWPGHPLSDEDGFRKDVIAALREIKCPIVRWPGGCYVSDYHWKCGVGPNRQCVP